MFLLLLLDKTRTLTEVRVLIPIKSGATGTFLKQFGIQLMNEHGLMAIDTDIDVFNNDGRSKDVVIVICNHHTRIVTNVSNALSKLKGKYSATNI